VTAIIGPLASWGYVAVAAIAVVALTLGFIDRGKGVKIDVTFIGVPKGVSAL